MTEITPEMRTDAILDILRKTIPPIRPEGCGVTAAECLEKLGISAKTASLKLDNIEELAKVEMVINQEENRTAYVWMPKDVAERDYPDWIAK